MGGDFSLEGGWIVVAGSGVSGLTIQNSNFFYGTTGTTFNSFAPLAASSYTIQNCTFTDIVDSTDSATNRAITGINLLGGVTIKDSVGNHAVLTGPPTTFTDPTVT